MRTPTGGTAYYALDGLGSPVGLINTNGVHIAKYSYDPYGAVTTSNLTGNSAANLNPYRFTGSLADRTTGYLKLGQRFYDPASGRWTQQDSIETLADPSRANRYEYAFGNPINYVDPTGEDGLENILAGLGGVSALLGFIALAPATLPTAVLLAVAIPGAIAAGGLLGYGVNRCLEGTCVEDE